MEQQISIPPVKYSGRSEMSWIFDVMEALFINLLDELCETKTIHVTK